LTCCENVKGKAKSWVFYASCAGFGFLLPIKQFMGLHTVMQATYSLAKT
jgi:hypothetical protein